MIGTSEILRSNEQIAQQHLKGRVAVFMGATAGIGQSTLNQMITMLDDSTFYVLGRNPTDIVSQLESLKLSASKRGNKIVFIESQVSCIAMIDAACDQILAAESRVHYLYTDEGLETCFAVSYYSRLRMVFKLLPLLQHSERPHVLSILNGTLEKAIYVEDLGLEKNWGITAVVNHTTVCTSLAFNYLARHNKASIIFLHATPGFVSTESPRKTRPSMDFGLLWWAFLSAMQVISGWVIYYFGMDVRESGQRHSYHLTSNTFQPGSWQVDRRSSVVAPNKVLKGYQEQGLAEKVWDHTLRIWDKALATSATS
ncbi:hypothetical protein QQS21_004497 [Conoideocrella luteorostrata]|uniref:NAD(P)-binding protein n=1 Tax=Conoideocrella luteorostrata TaxID=1105319 RepID=A0AAJ0FZR4_9HYPO|nr:hypothetical protein QQS21_004497 [Conoideocrella luteorostrata]